MKTRENIQKIKKIEEICNIIKRDIISLVDTHLSPDRDQRSSSLYPNGLATILADAALRTRSEKTSQWIRMNAKGRNLFGTALHPSEFSPLMWTSLYVLDELCGFPPPEMLQEKMPSPKNILTELDYPFSNDSSYIFPFHLACLTHLYLMEGRDASHLLQMIVDHQQPDGSWIDDTTATAMSVLALQQAEITPTYDFRNWLENARLPDGYWAAANGEVWEAAYALRTGEVPNSAQLANVIVECMHENYWWGFSRYSVPDADDMSAACYVLADHNPDLAAAALDRLEEVQDEKGGWGAFPEIEGTIPYETVVAPARESSCDITCHAAEALERNGRKGSAFKKGIYYLLENQKHEGYWRAPWWNSDFYVTTEIIFLLKQNNFEDTVFNALDWMEKKVNSQENLNITEYALMIGAFSAEYEEYFDCLDIATDKFLEKYRSEFLPPTFDIIYFAGLLDLMIYRLSVMLYYLRTFLRKAKSDLP